jgi:hypothetical protein
MLFPPKPKNESSGHSVFAKIPGINFAQISASVRSVSLSLASIDDLRRLVLFRSDVSGKGNFGLSTLPFGLRGIAGIGMITLVASSSDILELHVATMRSADSDQRLSHCRLHPFSPLMPEQQSMPSSPGRCS